MEAIPLVYLSYSNHDRAFVEELLTCTRPFERAGQFQAWSDHSIEAGSDFRREIDDALKRAAVAIVLVSPDYLASDWIQDVELPILLERQKLGTLRILPIIVRQAAWVHTPLAYFQVWPRDGVAAEELPAAARNRLWVDLTQEVAAIVHQLRSPVSEAAFRDASPGAERVPPVRQRRTPTKSLRSEDGPASSPGRAFFISHAREDGDFAENLKARMAQAGFTGWIDIDILEAGMSWRDEIDRAINESCAVILVLSPDGKASEYVTYEWAYGLGLGRRIVPLLLRDTPIHPRLEPFQYFDFTNRGARPWDRLFTLLGDLAAGRANPAGNVPPRRDLR